MLEIKVDGAAAYQLDNEGGSWTINQKPANLDVVTMPNGIMSVLCNGKSYSVIVEGTDRKNKEVLLRINGQSFRTEIKEPIDQLLSSMGMDLKARHKAEAVKAPMPGLVLRILVEPGQAVKKGEGLLVLEAMKMENILKAGEDCVVKAIKVAERTAVEKGAVLIELGS
jgi:biotin carboxyl carrier protein